MDQLDPMIIPINVSLVARLGESKETEIVRGLLTAWIAETSEDSLERKLKVPLFKEEEFLQPGNHWQFHQ